MSDEAAAEAAREALRTVVRSGRRAAVRDVLLRLARHAESGGVPVSWGTVVSARELADVCTAAAVAGLDCARDREWRPCPECLRLPVGSPPCCAPVAGDLVGDWGSAVAQTAVHLVPFRPHCAATFCFREAGAPRRAVRALRALHAAVVARFGETEVSREVLRDGGPRAAVACILIGGRGRGRGVPPEWTRLASSVSARVVRAVLRPSCSEDAAPPAVSLGYRRPEAGPAFPLADAHAPPRRRRAPAEGRTRGADEERLIAVSQEDYDAVHPDLTKFSVLLDD